MYPAYSFPQFLARLPQVAQKRFKALAAQLEDTEALLRLHMEREKEAEGRVFDAARRLDISRGRPDEVERIGAEREAALADLAELRAAREKLNARRGGLDNVVSRLRHNEIPQMGWLVPVSVEARPRKGESFASAVERTRAELMGLKGQLAATRAAPLPRDELLRMARVAVNDLAERGRPAVVTAGGKFEVRWDAFAVPGYPAAGDNYAPRLLAALFPEKVYELLARQIANVSGITAAERRDREAALEREILQAEHEEEALIRLAEAQGFEIARRTDASPHALLGCDPGELHARQVAEAAE
jgi:hypothetical protein